MMRMLYFCWAHPGQGHPVFRLELLMALGRGALSQRTLLGGRCCTTELNPPCVAHKNGPI